MTGERVMQVYRGEKEQAAGKTFGGKERDEGLARL